MVPASPSAASSTKATRGPGKNPCAFRCGDAGQAHFRLALGPDQAGDHLLPFQRHPHRVGAEDQQAGAVRLRFGEIARGVAAREFHTPQFPELAIRRVTI